jgi:hypothetical protein
MDFNFLIPFIDLFINYFNFILIVKFSVQFI